MTLVAWLGFVGVWLFRMNEALSLYDPLFIIPLLQVNFILFAIVSGGIYFKEFSYFELENTIGFVAGVLLLIFGIYLLSPEVALEAEAEGPGAAAVEMAAQKRAGEPEPGAGAGAGPEGPRREVPRTQISFTRRSIAHPAPPGADPAAAAGTPRQHPRKSVLDNFRFTGVVRRGRRCLCDSDFLLAGCQKACARPRGLASWFRCARCS